MTLIVAIKCTDGLVVAADGATTFGSLGNRTIRQPSRKLTIVNQRMIVGVSGPVGLQQRFVGELSAVSPGPNAKRHHVMDLLANAIRGPMRAEYQMLQAVGNTLGQVGLSSVLSSTVVATLIENVPTLIQFDQQGSPECATDDLRFISIGSGQPLADPFLAFLRRIFWNSKPPTLSDGIFAATWTLTHAIATNPGGVDAPTQVMTLACGTDGKCEIKELGDDDLAEHRQAIEFAEQRLGTFRDAITPRADEPTDAIPTRRAAADEPTSM